MRNLAPGYLRIGGTMADRLIFTTNDTQSLQTFNVEQDGNDCAYENIQCLSESRPNFTMSRKIFSYFLLKNHQGLNFRIGLERFVRFSR